MNDIGDALAQNQRLDRGVNIIATVHHCHPMDFTHQEAPWSEHRDKGGIVDQDCWVAPIRDALVSPER